MRAEFAAFTAAVLGLLAHADGRRAAFIFLLALLAICTRRSLEVSGEKPDAPLRLRFYRSRSGIKIKTRRYRIHWQSSSGRAGDRGPRDD